MPGPLSGVKILDWTAWQQGPVATSMLGDLGADVIKIENFVTGGDPGRGVKRIAGYVDCDLGNGLNYYFETNNRSKKSIAINMKKPKGREIIYRLVAKFDVFVQNFRQGAAVRLGVDYSTLTKYNPDLIYCNIGAFGQKGPDATRPAFDFTAQARSGFMHLGGKPGDEPSVITGGIVDQIGAIIASYGILAALVARERTGVGQEIDTSHLASALWLQGLIVPCQLILGREFPRWDRQDAKNPMWNYYTCADGEMLMLALFQSVRYWPDLCRALELEKLENDPRFATEEQRSQNNKELITILENAFRTKSSAEWERILGGYKDLIFQRVQTMAEVCRDPQVIENDYIVDLEHPILGKITVLNSPVRFSKTPASIGGPAPQLGENTEQILLDICQYSWDEIEEFKNDGAIL